MMSKEDFEFLNIVINNFILTEPPKSKGIISITDLKRPLTREEIYKNREDHIHSEFT